MNRVPGSPSCGRRRVLAGTMAALAAGIAGCGVWDGDASSPSENPFEYVPADAGVLVDVDVAFLDSPETVRLVEAYTDEGEDYLETFESRTGFELERVERVFAFAGEPRPNRMAFVVDADYTESAAVEAIEAERGVEYDDDAHERGTVYESADEAVALGVALEGQYVVAERPAVRAALEAVADEAAVLEGPMRETLEGSWDVDSGGAEYVLAATDQPRAYLPDEEAVPAGVTLEMFESLEFAAARYVVDDAEGVGADVELVAPDEELAVNLADFVFSGLMGLRQTVGDRHVAEQLTLVEVDRHEATVTVTYRSDVEGAEALVEWIAGEL